MSKQYQTLLNEFQTECLKSLYEDSETRQELREFIKEREPLNGLIMMIKPTRTYIKYLRSHKIKVGKQKNLLSYLSLDEFLKHNTNLSPNFISLLGQYSNLDSKFKSQALLCVFQVPYSYNPSQSCQNFVLVNDLELELPTKIMPGSISSS